MDDEFKLCWKNFQDNIASGFQSLYDRGDLVDVTLACDGKLLQAHKIVLAICSPYFQEIFVTNPCKHPIIILKDVSYTIMCELLEFMYQGVVNVKHTELQAFMKIGQLLQIKGLATNTSSSSAGPSLSDKSSLNQNPNEREPSQPSSSTPKSAASPNIEAGNHNDSTTNNSEKPSQTPTNATTSSNTPQRIQSPDMSSPASPSLNISNVSQKQGENNAHHNFHLTPSSSGLKRHLSDFNSDSLSIYSRNKNRRTTMPTDQSSDNNEGSDVGGSSSMDQMNAEDFFMPHMSMVEGRYDLNSVKREGSEHHHNANSSNAAAAAAAAASLRNSFNPAAFGLDYSFYKNNNSGSASTISQEFPNELNISSGDYSKGFANHMDIPPIGPGEHWFQGKLEFMLSQRGKPLLVHDGHTFGIQYVRKDKKYWQCNLSRKFNCKARVTTTDTGEIIVTNNEHCHTEIRQHLRKDYQRNKVMMNALINLSTNRLAVENLRRHNVNSIASNLSNLVAASAGSPLSLQSHMEAANVMAGTLLDLGKRSISLDNEDHMKLNHQHQQQLQQHQLQHEEHQQTSLHPESRAMHNLEDGASLHDEQPLDCGMRSSDRERFEHGTRSYKQDTSLEAYKDPHIHRPTSPNTNSNNNSQENADWSCKNETGIQH
ncbi:broad-complex core protein isoforms 1/2/3/4/5 [Musca vetustissima]|uniref:broad-complex core protein isoforms 1/2/3/4/5 n=1 Tax=Musca vetustissima TaxID=27455 RepID=UPI002AB757F7|nr:broad-complex core protein isoforms 1/2/3/4/5 [Musca vetustissima]